MRNVVSDSSCIIDIRKASLLNTFLLLPYEFLIPNTLFDDELLSFTGAEKEALVRGGLRIMDLPGASVLRARAIARQMPSLSIHDAFAFALAESHPGCILLTADRQLRSLAAQHNLEVHGILWVIDEINRCHLADATTLIGALRALSMDPTVRLPSSLLTTYLERYEAMT